MITATLTQKQCEIEITRTHLISDGQKIGTSSITYEALCRAIALAGFTQDEGNTTEIYEQPQISKLPYPRFSYERFDRKWRKENISFSVNLDKGDIYCHPEQQEAIINQLNKVQWEEPASFLHKKTWKEDTEYFKLLARPGHYYEYDVKKRVSPAGVIVL
jgi:hypothetical protein